MSFSNYKTIGEVLKEFLITYLEENFIEEISFDISDYFRQDLEMVIRDGVVDSSEYAICENLIYPVLKEVWKVYKEYFILWSHHSLNYDEKLNGFPEYILAKRSPLGKLVFDQPYLVIVEAKKDNFEQGWSQCLAEMIAAQKLNNEFDVLIFGIVSNGDRWQFGKLDQDKFIRNKKLYSLQRLDELFAAVNYIYQQSQLEIKQLISVST